MKNFVLVSAVFLILFASSIGGVQTSNAEIIAQDTISLEWRKAKEAGYSKEQFDQIMKIPKFDQESSRQNTNASVYASNEQNRVVSEAKKHIGKPYQWGGKGPDRFDCSGLVQYVYRQAVNINVPAPTYNQEKYGREVSLKSLQPGDLVFYGNRGSTFHVGIYIGSNQMIHAPQPGEYVSILNLKSWAPSFARRILKDPPANNYERINSRKKLNNTTAVVKNMSELHGVHSGPYNTGPGTTKVLETNKAYAGKLVEVLEEATTNRATYVRFRIDGKEIGWMDKRAFSAYYEKINNRKQLKGMTAIVKNMQEDHGVHSGPYNTGANTTVTLATNKNYTNKLVEVIEEATTNRATYVKFRIDGKEIGWMDKRAFSTYYEKINTRKKLNNMTAIINDMKEDHGVHFGPYNTAPNTTAALGTNKTYANQLVEVLEEATTNRATYVKFKLDGKDIGWMDKRAFSAYYEKIISRKQYEKVTAIIKEMLDTHGVHAGPYNTAPNTTARLATNQNYANMSVQILEEATTNRATYVKFALNGKEIGWLDKQAFSEF